MSVSSSSHFKVRTPDGVVLHSRFVSARGRRKGVVVLVHGLGEHLGRYEGLVAALAGQGWDVLAYDHRGHGRSPGKRGDVAGATSLLEDLGQVIDAARTTLQPGPLVLLGHSLGALVAARFVAEALQQAPQPWSRPVDGLLLSSPPFDAGIPRLKRAGIALLSKLLPHLCVANGLKPSWVCSDPAVVQAYVGDKLVHDRISALLASFIAKAGQEVLDVAPHWRVPTLLMWAGRDQCLNPGGSVRFAQLAPAEVLSAKDWPTLAHEIFNEPEKAQVTAHALGWLALRYPSTAADAKVWAT